MRRLLLSIGAIGLVVTMLEAHEARPKTPLIVHEWGTITTHHAPDGTPQGRLNRINPREVLPQFVHQFDPTPASNSPPTSLLKSPYIQGRPDITMRLETPVIYFYPPAGAGPVPAFNVSVRFRGGIINEFYPDAEPSVVTERAHVAVLPASWHGALDGDVVGRLLWGDIRLQDSVPLARTSSNVWLAPRRVASTSVLARSGEGERYLFYRGVAHLDALFQTAVTPNDVRLRAPRALDWMTLPSMTIARLWLLDIRADGAIAFRERDSLTIMRSAPSAELGSLPLFANGDYKPGNLDALRSVMKRSLVAAGLYDAEATAMLATWNESYFRTPGLRIFYIVPDEWLGYYLPLNVSAPHELTRVLVGRIDLVAPNAE